MQRRSQPYITFSRAVRRLTPGKAVGPSGIHNDVLKALANTQPQAVLRTFNDCLGVLTFPPRWKRARLVLLRKGPDKPLDVPSSYGPICILDTSGKLLERLLLQRLEEHLEKHEGRRKAPNQYGFRKGVSTEFAISSSENWRTTSHYAWKEEPCILVILDIKNTFNFLTWLVIDAALRNINVPEYLLEMLRFWLSDRVLLTGEEMATRPVTCRVLHGSVLGPTLWNVAYDSFLKMDMPPEMQLIGFADDLAVVGIASTGQLLEDVVNPTLMAVDGKQGR